jgi:hypothetical protein
VNLIPQPSSFGDRGLALSREEIEDDAVVFSMHERQLGRLLTHTSSNGTSIEAV